jgi:hypothetical protein
MGRNLTQLRHNAVLLKDDSIGVSTEETPRKLQHRNGQTGYYVSLNPDWVDQLNLGDDHETTLHSVSVGVQPVIVQNPAIIIQPKHVLEDSE